MGNLGTPIQKYIELINMAEFGNCWKEHGSKVCVHVGKAQIVVVKSIIESRCYSMEDKNVESKISRCEKIYFRIRTRTTT